MVNTRSTSAKKFSNMENLNEATTPSTENTTSESEVNRLIESLSPESRQLVKVLTMIISIELSVKLSNIQKELDEKDKKLDLLTSEVNGLKEKIFDLESNIDTVDQYERRDTIILSGPSLPPETNNEHTATVVIDTIKDNLKINLKETDISVTHRLGPQKQQRNRPIIVKLMNRSLKQDLVGACINLKPKLFINESLTPKRRNLFNTVLNIRRQLKAKFQQCYTKDGTVIIKLRNSTVKHSIVDERSLMTFLNHHPLMMDTYRQTTSQS